MTKFNLQGPSNNSRTTEATVVKFYTNVDHIELVVLG